MPLLKVILLVAALFSAAGLSAATLSFSGYSDAPVAERPATSTGLEGVYVFRSLSGVQASLSGIPAAASVEWTMFDVRGLAFAEPVSPSDIVSGQGISTLTALESDRGYCATFGGTSVCFWVIDYSLHPYAIEALVPADEQECDMMALLPQGKAPRLTYTSTSGRQVQLSRDITVSYTTMRAESSEPRFVECDTVIHEPYIDGTLHLPAPLCDTRVTLSADRFMRAWGMDTELLSPMITATAVQAVTSARQHGDKADNEMNQEGDSGELGGSAPAEISFDAAVSPAAVYHEWTVAADPEFYETILRTSDLSFTHTFMDSGTYYARFMADNSGGTCAYESDLYVIAIGESSLVCPNAFSPGASEGVNDIWKVSYKSIVDFECYIFNGWGVKIAELHNPADGWDGRYRGKIVSPGVYYYVIKARGSDGREYNLSGDINIIGYTGTSKK